MVRFWHVEFTGMLMLSRVPFFVTPWIVAHQASLSLGFPGQEYWSGLLFPPPGDLPDSGIGLVSLVSPALQADSLLLSHQGNIVIKFSSVQWLSCV